MASTWKEVRTELQVSDEDEAIIALEKDLIKTIVKIREEQGLSQAQLAKLCHVKQPFIARMETAAHSPQIDSLLRILIPLGYTLKIEPVVKKC
jgi:predicted transcriptional regulator